MVVPPRKAKSFQAELEQNIDNANPIAVVNMLRVDSAANDRLRKILLDHLNKKRQNTDESAGHGSRQCKSLRRSNSEKLLTPAPPNRAASDSHRKHGTRRTRRNPRLNRAANLSSEGNNVNGRKTGGSERSGSQLLRCQHNADETEWSASRTQEDKSSHPDAVESDHSYCRTSAESTIDGTFSRHAGFINARNGESRRGSSGGRTPPREFENAREVVPFSPDPVELVRQAEEDERMATMLQAQFYAEEGPDSVPHREDILEPPVDRKLDYLDNVTDSGGLDYLTYINIPIYHRGAVAVYSNRTALPTANFLASLDSDGDVISRGLPKSGINRLPTRKYIHSAASSSSSEVRTCEVCLADYEDGDILRMLPCFHEFHTPCIDPWLAIDPTCPVCRVTVDLDA